MLREILADAVTKLMSDVGYGDLHCSPMGRRFGGRRGDWPVAGDVCDAVVAMRP